MLLVERTEELAGARGASTTAYTLRFAHDGVDLLLRVSGDGDAVPHRRLGGPAARRDRPALTATPAGPTTTSRSATPAASSSPT